jgi:hypothetical protein
MPKETDFDQRLLELDRHCRQYAPVDYAAGKWVETAAAFDLEEKLPQKNSYTYGMLMDMPQIGVNGVRLIAGTIMAGVGVDPLMSMTHTAMSSQPGIELWQDTRQQMIDSLSAAGDWETKAPGLTAFVKSLGIKLEKRWRLHGYSDCPTPTECQQAKSTAGAYATWKSQDSDRRSLRQQAQFALNEVVVLIEEGDGTTSTQDMVDAFSAALTQ